MRVLVVNAGSSSLKLRVIDEDDGVAASVDVDPWDGDTGVDLSEPLAEVGTIDAAGHRVVHGGRALTAATLLTPDTEAAIAELTSLAPLHQPRALAAVAAARRARPDVPHVACFDTAFHATLAPAARTYALPRAWRERWGLDRHGFHGLSHAWAARRGPEVAAGSLAGDRIVSCHLGAGASLCAITGGRSVDTTMGFTPNDGLVMATRSGAVDPGLVLWLLTDAGLSLEEVTAGLERHAGLAGLAGGRGDMREVLEARSAGDPAATLAFEVYVHRLRQGIASMASTLGGLDLLVFTGGVGEHAAPVRAAAVDGLAFLGLGQAPDANAVATADADITAAGARARTVVVTSREDLEIARQVRRLLG